MPQIRIDPDPKPIEEIKAIAWIWWRNDYPFSNAELAKKVNGVFGLKLTERRVKHIVATFAKEIAERVRELNSTDNDEASNNAPLSR
jgi:hypothetical protein